jgi:hypothetical protein
MYYNTIAEKESTITNPANTQICNNARISNRGLTFELGNRIDIVSKRGFRYNPNITTFPPDIVSGQETVAGNAVRRRGTE